jgi:hypothetical protein
MEAFSDGVVAVPVRGDDDYRIVQMGIREIVRPARGAGWDGITNFANPGTEGIAQILFTSGTEFAAKGVVLSHRNLADVVCRLNDVMHVDSSIREYVGVPVYHSFGFGRCRAVAAAGGLFFIPENGFNPLEVREMLQSGKINAVSAVPSLWRVLLANKKLFGAEAAKLKWIEIGSQYMSWEEKDALRKLFNNAVIVQHYGLTEASRTTFLEVHSAPIESLETVGRPVGKTEVKLATDGRIMIRGPHVAAGYLIDGTLSPIVNEDGWFTTNDLGTLSFGYLSYQGRADDVINCGGIKVSPDLVEAHICRQLGLTAGVVVTRIPDPIRGDGILVVKTPEVPVDIPTLHTAAASAILQFGIRGGDAIKVWTMDSFPTTDSGKIQRKKISEAFAAETGESSEGFFFKPGSDTSTSLARSQRGLVEPATPDEKMLIQIWEEVLGIHPIGVDESFVDLGGDSLSAISLMIRMEAGGFDMRIGRKILQGFTIRDIAKSDLSGSREEGKEAGAGWVDTSTRTKAVLGLNLTRSLLVLLVISAHWAAGLLGRLPEQIAPVHKYLYPIFSFGTPGFAIIFGVSCGYVFYPRFARVAGSLINTIRTGAVLVGAGILTLGVIRIATLLAQGKELSSTQLFNSFYSVLPFYFLAIPSLYFIFRLIRAFGKKYLIVCIAAASASFLIYVFMEKTYAGYEVDGVVEYIKLILTAKYSYFSLLTGVFVGLAIGIYYSDNYRNKGLAKLFLKFGAFLLLTGIAGSALVGEWQLWLAPSEKVQLWKWFAFGGLALIVLAVFRVISFRYDTYSSRYRQLLHLLAAPGQLALPLFVAHESVIPLKDLLVALGLAAIPALMFTLSLFAVFVALAVRKIASLYHDES